MTRLLAAIVAVLLCSILPVYAQGRVEVIADLLPLLPKATIADASAVEVKEANPAGGVLQRALFEHPKTETRPASVTFPLQLPSVKPGERLIFAFDVALSDGVPWKTADPAPDGVRFEAVVEGKSVYSQTWRKSEWRPGSVDLTARAGRRVSLTLRVHPLTRLNYDWALWGRPRILRVTSTPLRDNTTDVAIGILTVDGATIPRRVRLIPDSSETPLVWERTEESGTSGDAATSLSLEYRFPRARRVRIESEQGDAIRLSVAAFAPMLQIETIACADALPLTGEPTTLRVTVRNAGPGMLRSGAATANLTVGSASRKPQQIPALSPGEVWRGVWTYHPTRAERVLLTGSVKLAGSTPITKRGIVEAFLAPRAQDSLSSEHLRFAFARDGKQGIAGAIVHARRADRWVRIGSLYPLFRIGQESADWLPRPRKLTLLPRSAKGEVIGQFKMDAPNPDKTSWNLSLTLQLDGKAALAQLRYAYQPGMKTTIRSLSGPNLYVGDGTVGEASSGGLFPGLEYLSGGEPSSSARGFAPPLHERFTPHPDKITIPLMAVSIGADSIVPPLNPGPFYCPDSLKDMPRASTKELPLTVALLWDNRPTGSAERPRPSARFASPNRQEGMANHRLSLFLPSVPGDVPENVERSAKPFPVPAGRTLTMEATLSITIGTPLTAVRSWLQQVGGLPVPPAWPRSESDAFALSREAFLTTVWNPATKKWRGSQEFGDEAIPGIAALLYLDSRTTTDTEAARLARTRVDEGVQAMLAEGGPSILSQRSACHIMRFELPFLYGYLPEALDGLEREIRQIEQGQLPDGGRHFHSEDPPRASLGAKGDSVCGLASHHAWMLLRYARITGDAQALAAGERALRWIARFRVPRGASVWECPIYEPDILAAAWNLAACIEGYRATGNRRYMHDGIYWAETALPFIYLWSRPNRPAMLGASIATFGTTFYTHSWLATPVQWEGLTLAYHLRHLADALEQAGPFDDTATDSPLPLSLRQTPANWRQLADLLFVSGLHQQVAEGERKGTYPDSITDFTRPNPVFINPENIMAYLLTRKGHDPDIKTVTVTTPAGNLRISSGASATPEVAGNVLRLRLRYFPGENSQVLIAGLRPASARVNGALLPQQATPIQRTPGWNWDERTQRTYLCIPHSSAEVSVEVQF